MTTHPQAAAPSVSDRAAMRFELLAHVQYVGDARYDDDGWVGEPGSGKAIEGFSLRRTGPGGPKLRYRGFEPDGTATRWCEDGEFCGTRGQRRALSGLCLAAADAGADAPLSYSARFTDGVVIGPVPLNTPCHGTADAVLEAIRLHRQAAPGAGMPRTLVFCTAFVHPVLTPRSSWDGRYAIWRAALARSRLHHDQVLIVDDGSPTPPPWSDVQIIAEGAPLTTRAPTVVYRFAQSLGRKGVSDFPGWVRSFQFAARFAEANGFERVIHIESDAFVISPRLQEYLNGVRDGWWAPFCPRYNRPESAIQVIAGSALATYRELAARPVDDFAGVVIEKALPFTQVDRSFIGDRHGEYLDHVPRDADWTAQANPDRSTDPTYCWWLAPQPAPPTPTPTPTPAPVPPAPAPVASSGAGHRLTLVDQEPRIGRFLHDLVNERQFVDFYPLDDAATLERPAPFHPDPPEPGAGPFGQFMLNPGFRRYRAEAVAAYEFEDAYVIGSDGVVLLHGAVLRGTLDYLSYWSPDSNVREFRRNEWLRLREAMPVASFLSEGRYLIGFGGAWRDHDNWLLQCVPKLYAFTLLRRRFRDLKLVLPPLRPGSMQARTLDLLGIGADAVHTLAPDRVTGFAHAIVLPNFDLWNITPFVALAAERIAAAAMQGVAAEAGPQRVYLRRKAETRQPGNWAELAPLVERHGFAVRSLDDADFAEQVRAMQSARLVIGEYGAGAANLLFCRDGARVLELFSPFCVQPTSWSIAARRGLDYGYVVGAHRPTERHPTANWNSAYDMPPTALEAGLRALLAKPATDSAQPAPTAAPMPAPTPAPVAPPPAPVPATAGGTAAADAPTAQPWHAPPPEQRIRPEDVPFGLSQFSGLAEPVFEVTSDLGSFGHAAAHQRLNLFAAALPPPQAPIHRQQDIPAEFVAEHLHYPAPAAVGVYAVRNAMVWGNGLVTLGPRFFAPNDCLPGYWQPQMLPGGQPIHAVHQGSLGRSEVETVVIDGPVAVALHPNLVYGHFLLEMLPRLYVLALLRAFGARFPLLLSVTVPNWVKTFVRLLHPEEAIHWYDAQQQRVLGSSVILPSMMHTDHNFHPAFNLMVDSLIERLRQPGAPAGPERVYISRANFGDERIENEDEVAALMAEHGFAVVRPHELTPEQQVTLFSGARVVAGEYGSGLHNAMFSPAGARVIALNFFNNYQSKIARVRGHRMAFVPPADGIFRHWRITAKLPRKFRIDLETLRRTLGEVLDSAA